VLGCVVAGVSVPAFLAIRGPESVSTIGTLDFANPLVIPPLLEPTLGDDGTKRFDLTLQTGEARIFGDGETATWGVNGPFLAPTLRARRGDRVRIAVHNDLPEETSIHWHGMHLPAAMDGGPHQIIAIGETWEPFWEIEQPASTLWYHPHPHGKTGLHVYRGIAGLFLIDDDEEAALPLPRDWGVDDIPVIIQDKAVSGDQFDEHPGNVLNDLTGASSFGIRGDRILVNGTFDPFFEVTTRVVRLRLLNGSNARFYNVGFDDDRSFRLLATDSGLVPGDVPEVDRLLLGPGERAELLVAFAPGDTTILRSFAQDLDVAGTVARQLGSEDTFDVLQFRAADSLGGVRDLPGSVLPPVEASLPDDATVRRFRLDGHNRINDREMDMQRIDEVIPAGALEIWEIESNGQPHTFHIHGATFQVLAVDAGEVPPHLRGPKDTVKVTPGHAVRLAVQFLHHVDPTMPYMFHCHILRHEDNGMMGQFVVVEPGTEATTPTQLDGVHPDHE
jgi:FtsP/CotA-like multicopper oxidase with cupredoxin domain